MKPREIVAFCLAGAGVVFGGYTALRSGGKPDTPILVAPKVRDTSGKEPDPIGRLRDEMERLRLKVDEAEENRRNAEALLAAAGKEIGGRSFRTSSRLGAHPIAAMFRNRRTQGLHRREAERELAPLLGQWGLDSATQEEVLDLWIRASRENANLAPVLFDESVPPETLAGRVNEVEKRLYASLEGVLGAARAGELRAHFSEESARRETAEGMLEGLDLDPFRRERAVAVILDAAGQPEGHLVLPGFFGGSGLGGTVRPEGIAQFRSFFSAESVEAALAPYKRQARAVQERLAEVLTSEELTHVRRRQGRLLANLRMIAEMRDYGETGEITAVGKPN